MQINENYWGSSEDRTSLYDGTFETTNYDLMTAMNNDRIPLNEPLDTSISPWSINADADVAQLWYPTFYRDGDTTNILGSIYKIHNENDTLVNGVPFYFAVPHYSGNGGFNFNWFARNGYAQAVIQDTTANALRDMVYPVTKFDYGRLAYYIQLRVADYKMSEVTNDSSFWSTGSMSLDNYINNQIDRPILGINFIPYYATYDDYPNNREPIEIIMNSIALKDPMPIQGQGMNGYDIDFVDDFMTINKSNTNTQAPSIGSYGQYAYYTLGADSIWATNPADSLQYNYGVDRNDLPILHIGGGRWFLETFWTGTYTIYYRTELRPQSFESYDDLKDYILTQAAYLGTWFCTDATDITNTAPGSTSNWYLGEIGENGITTGFYEQGVDTANLNNADWVDPWEESGWQGRSDDPNPYDIDLTTQISTLIMVDDPGTKDYIMTVNAFATFINEVNTRYQQILTDSIFTPEAKELALYAAFGTTDNPLTLIKVANRFPFDLGTGLKSDPTDTIRLGNTDFQIVGASAAIGIVDWNSNATDMVGGHPYMFSAKPINYFQRYNSFIDFEPYCAATLMVPWCGSVRIDPELYVGHQIGCEYVYDVYSGACSATIYRDALAMDKITGSIGAAFNINAINYTDVLESQIQARAYQRANHENLGKIISDVAIGATAVAATVATAGAAAPVTAGALASGMAGKVALGAGVKTIHDIHTAQVAAENYHVKPASVSFKQIGSDEGMLGLWAFEKKLRLNITRPTFLNGYTKDNFGNYGHTVGFACLKYDKLENYSGLTVCGSVDLTGCSATDQEINMIRKALQTGVYLP